MKLAGLTLAYNLFTQTFAQTTESSIVTPCVFGEPGCVTTAVTDPDLVTPCSLGEENCTHSVEKRSKRVSF